MRRLLWIIIDVAVALLIAGAIWPAQVLGARSFPTSAPLDISGFVLAGAIVFGFVFLRFKWAHHLDTLIHEFGHAAVAALLGGTPKAIKLNTDTSGVTHFAMRKPGRLKSLLTSAAGPLASAVCVAIGASYLQAGRASIFLLFAVLIVGLVLLSTMRNLWGWVVGLAISAVLVASVFASTGFVPGLSIPGADGIVVAVITGVAAGIALRQSVRRRKYASNASDEAHVSRASGMPLPFVHFLLAATNFALIVLALNVTGTIDIDRVPEYAQSATETISSLLAAVGVG